MSKSRLVRSLSLKELAKTLSTYGLSDAEHKFLFEWVKDDPNSETWGKIRNEAQKHSGFDIRPIGSIGDPGHLLDARAFWNRFDLELLSNILLVKSQADMADDEWRNQNRYQIHSQNIRDLVEFLKILGLPSIPVSDEQFQFLERLAQKLDLRVGHLPDGTKISRQSPRMRTAFMCLMGQTMRERCGTWLDEVVGLLTDWAYYDQDRVTTAEMVRQVRRRFRATGPLDG